MKNHVQLFVRQHSRRRVFPGLINMVVFGLLALLLMYTLRPPAAPVGNALEMDEALNQNKVRFALSLEPDGVLYSLSTAAFSHLSEEAVIYSLGSNTGVQYLLAIDMPAAQAAMLRAGQPVTLTCGMVSHAQAYDMDVALDKWLGKNIANEGDKALIQNGIGYLSVKGGTLWEGGIHMGLIALLVLCLLLAGRGLVQVVWGLVEGAGNGPIQKDLQRFDDPYQAEAAINIEMNAPQTQQIAPNLLISQHYLLYYSKRGHAAGVFPLADVVWAFEKGYHYHWQHGYSIAVHIYLPDDPKKPHVIGCSNQRSAGVLMGALSAHCPAAFFGPDPERLARWRSNRNDILREWQQRIQRLVHSPAQPIHRETQEK